MESSDGGVNDTRRRGTEAQRRGQTDRSAGDSNLPIRPLSVSDGRHSTRLDWIGSSDGRAERRRGVRCAGANGRRPLTHSDALTSLILVRPAAVSIVATDRLHCIALHSQRTHIPQLNRAFKCARLWPWPHDCIRGGLASDSDSAGEWKWTPFGCSARSLSRTADRMCILQLSCGCAAPCCSPLECLRVCRCVDAAETGLAAAGRVRRRHRAAGPVAGPTA